MKISFNWLKQYINFNLSPEETGVLLTNCGLEVEKIESFEIIKGGLKGLVVGEVLTCEPHPDSDHLHVTTVNIGTDSPSNIVCGAANIAAGQKVIVATIGTILYDGDNSFTIKKSKLRGCVSEGMICAEDEIGLGTSHDGIMVLEENAVPGTPASQFFNIESDYIFEIGITPNRSDAISHLGVARDLYAMLVINKIPCSQIIFPAVRDFIPTSKKNKIDITIENKISCPRYVGVTLDNVQVGESPEWIQHRLRSIGVRPINNIVDITQYIMFECGQPLHAFDADKIKGNRVIIKNLAEGTPFQTLDGNEIKLSKEDLMICNSEEGMCIAGVYGGLKSGITEHTKNIFLESAYFEPTTIRKTSKRHGLKTDASFRFERGGDPDIAVYALKRMVNLLQKYAKAVPSSEIMDVYPSVIEKRNISLTFEAIYKIAGKKIEPQVISNILLNLGFEIVSRGAEVLMVRVPLNKVDILRPIDLIEEILRIYGYNNIEIPNDIHYFKNFIPSDDLKIDRRKLSLYLAHQGFIEIMNNSLTKSAYSETFGFINQNEDIAILNPLSKELNCLRQTLLFGGLETVIRNFNNRNSNLRLFEFGKVYHKNRANGLSQEVTERYLENQKFCIWITGKEHEEIWNDVPQNMDFFSLKTVVNNIFSFMNISLAQLQISNKPSDIFVDRLTYLHNDEEIVTFGEIHPQILKYFDIKKAVFYAEFDFDLLAQLFHSEVKYAPLPIFPSVKRDLALIVDKSVTYKTLEEIAYKYGTNRLKRVSLFDVYEGDKLEADKKSYALSFVINHPDKTMTEEEINKIMNKLINAFEKECNAKLR